MRPSTAVTVALSLSVALIDRRSTASGNARRRHERPSVDNSTVPERPISQQTDGDGETPAVSVSVAPVVSIRQVAPPSAERCTPPPISRRNRVAGFDDTTTLSNGFAKADTRAVADADSRRRLRSADGAGGGAAGATVGAAAAALRVSASAIAFARSGAAAIFFSGASVTRLFASGLGGGGSF